MSRGLAGRWVAALASAGLLAGVVGASPAFAGSPWWGVTMSARPTYLQPGQGRNEVQEVRVSGAAGSYELIKPEPAETEKAGKDFVLLSASASAAEVQHKLENEEMYGAHDVTVRSVPGPLGGRAFQITFAGQLEDQSLAVIEAKNIEGAAVSTRQVSEGRPDGIVVVNFVNRGEADVEPVGGPVTVADVLPSGMKALALEGTVSEGIKAEGFGIEAKKLECTLASVSCTFTGKAPAGAGGRFLSEYPLRIPPYLGIQLRVAVKLTGAVASTVNEASVSGGNAAAVSVRRDLTVSSAPEPFGVSLYEVSAEEAGGGVDTQAGSHPFQVTTSLMFNDNYEGRTPALPKDLSFKLPPGLVGNPEPVTRCTLKQFLAGPEMGTDRWCPQASVVGVARVYSTIEAGEVGTTTLFPGSYAVPVSPFEEPVFNIEPEAGEPARFGFAISAGPEFVPVLLDTSVRTGGDYGVAVDVRNITQSTDFLGSEVTLWGVPGDELHNTSRGEECLELSVFDSVEGPVSGECAPFTSHNPPPFFSLPTSCTGPLLTTLESDSWREPGVFSETGNTAPLPAMDGCNRLPFTPSIKVTPDASQASKPTGLNVDVHVPQDLTLNPTGLSESEVRDITVALPEGVAINPAGGDGLEACPEALIGYKGQAESPLEPGVSNPVFPPNIPGGPKNSEPLLQGVNFCANASKIGTVTIRTPLLPNALEGAVYLASQEANPFGSLVAMYVVAQDPVSGSVIVLPGVVHLTPTGQIVSTFENDPQLPFEDAELHFFGGERAPLTSPARCGAYTTHAQYTPWSGNETVDSSSTFEITSGPNGSPCPGAALPFNPSLTAGTTSIQAGGFSPFTMTMSREDGQQQLQAIDLHMPPGVSGLLAGVELCQEPQADRGTCGPNSLIGETTVGVGVGGDPFSVKGGKVYITGPYKGAPFGLSIVNPAKAGPFDLEKTQANHPACDCLVVRAKIEVDPITAQLTVTSDNEGPYRIPTILEGIPLQIQHVNVTINRPGFAFNPTNCNPMQITGALSSAEGGSSSLTVPFQATNCAVLGFKPGFTISTSGKTNRRNGASLHVRLSYPKAPFGSQANIKSVKVDLPRQLPSRLPTLQHACPHQTFEADPASCPATSRVGEARADTPLIPVPLTGPAYFVSYGGAKFPELVIVLQGYGVTLDLHGETFISEKTSITSSTFKTVPDAPVGSFELTLPQGPNSALAANTNLCTVKGGLRMPTLFTAQNGATIKQNTPIHITGCPKTKHKPEKHGKKARHARVRARRSHR